MTSVTYRGVRALVLGASGFIGAWTARALHAQGADVIAVFRDPTRASETFGDLATDLEVLAADLARRGEATRLVERTRPAVVFNLAGYGVDRSERDPALMAALNAGLVRELCAALVTTPPAKGWAGARLVHAGSALEYGRLAGRLRETAAEEPTTDYGRTKLEGTRRLVACCAASGLRGVVARLFTVYGPGEHFDRLLPALMRTARTGVRLGLTLGTQRRNFTYVEDAAEGLTRLGTSAVSRGSEVVNLGVERLASVREFAETAAAVLGFDSDLLVFGALPDREDEMWHGEVDVTRLRTLTSWLPPTPIADGIRRSWEFSHAE